MGRSATTVAIYVSLILSGAIAGFFYSYSVTVMPGLDIAQPSVAIEAMQKINIVVRNPVFFVTFFLTPVVIVVSVLGAWLCGARGAALALGAAAAVYVLAAFLPTAQINVPMNNALAVIDPASADAAAIWAEYSEDWTWWNTARTIASLVSLAFVGAGLQLFAASPRA